MEAPFFIGQEVVALKTHPTGCPKKGNKYTVHGVYKYPCCNYWVVDYGEARPYKGYYKCTCHKCEKVYSPSICNSGNYILCASWFAPVTRLRISDKLTIAEGLAKEPVEERADVLTEIINH